MRLTFFLLSMLVAPALLAGARTPITISHFDDDGAGRYALEVEVEGATPQSQVVVLLRVQGSPGLQLAMERQGDPAMPETVDADRSLWTVEFYRQPSAARIIEIYAIVCEVRPRTGWSLDRDYRGFRFLPFANAKTINDALNVLGEFGWTPTGLTQQTTGGSPSASANTHSADSCYSGDCDSLDSPPGQSSPSSQGTSICQTPAMWCRMGVRGPVQSPCYCNTPFGPVSGVTVPEK